MTEREAVLRQWELERVRLEQSRPKFNHFVHIVATLFTGGLWLPGYVIHYLYHTRDEKAYDKQMQDFYARYRAALQFSG